MNERAPDKVSLQLTPTTRPRARGPSEKRWSAGASRTQGSHQLAQKTISVGLPTDVTGGPARRSVGSRGARRPTDDEREEARPNATSAPAPAAAAIPRSSFRRRDIRLRDAQREASRGTSCAMSAGWKLAA